MINDSLNLQIIPCNLNFFLNVQLIPTNLFEIAIKNGGPNILIETMQSWSRPPDQFSLSWFSE